MRHRAFRAVDIPPPPRPPCQMFDHDTEPVADAQPGFRQQFCRSQVCGWLRCHFESLVFKAGLHSSLLENKNTSPFAVISKSPRQPQPQPSDRPRLMSCRIFASTSFGGVSFGIASATFLSSQHQLHHCPLCRSRYSSTGLSAISLHCIIVSSNNL